MDLDEYNAFCGGLPAAAHVVQWGGAHVWKVGGKVFAIARPSDGEGLAVTFKTSGLSYEVLKDLPGCRPAPYLASRGMKWIQRIGPQSVDDEALRDYVRQSHASAVARLTAKARRGLGL